MCRTKKVRTNHQTKLIAGQEKNKRNERRPELHRGQGSSAQGESQRGRDRDLMAFKDPPTGTEVGSASGET